MAKLTQKDIRAPCSLQHYLFTISKIRKQPKCPLIDEWIRKMWYIYAMEYYSDIQKGNLAICDNIGMKLEGITLSEKVRER